MVNNQLQALKNENRTDNPPAIPAGKTSRDGLNNWNRCKLVTPAPRHRVI